MTKAAQSAANEIRTVIDSNPELTGEIREIIDVHFEELVEEVKLHVYRAPLIKGHTKLEAVLKKVTG